MADRHCENCLQFIADLRLCISAGYFRILTKKSPFDAEMADAATRLAEAVEADALAEKQCRTCRSWKRRQGDWGGWCEGGESRHFACLRGPEDGCEKHAPAGDSRLDGIADKVKGA